MWRDQQSGSEYGSDCDFRPEVVSGSPRKIMAGAPRVTVPNGRWSQAYISGRESPPVAAHPHDGPEPPYDDDSIIFSSDSDDADDEGGNDTAAAPEDCNVGACEEDATEEDVIDESFAVEQETDTDTHDEHRAIPCDREDGIGEGVAGEEQADSSVHDEHHDTTPAREVLNGVLHDDHPCESVGEMVGRDENLDAREGAPDETTLLDSIHPPQSQTQAVHAPKTSSTSQQFRANGAESICGHGSFSDPYTFLDESSPPPDDVRPSDRQSSLQVTEQTRDGTGVQPSASTPPTTAPATSAREPARSLASTSIRDLAAMATTMRAPTENPTSDKAP